MTPGKRQVGKYPPHVDQKQIPVHPDLFPGKFLDILPYRASKGKAIRYLSYKWGIPLKNLLVCGDSGNDAEMLKGEPLGVVVGNYSPELETLRSAKQIYFAEKTYAGGILEGIRHYQFIR